MFLSGSHSRIAQVVQIRSSGFRVLSPCRDRAAMASRRCGRRTPNRNGSHGDGNSCPTASGTESKGLNPNLGGPSVGNLLGTNLLRNLLANKRFKVSLVVELSPERREYVRGLYPAIKVTADLEEVIRDPKIEAMAIATPVATHFDRLRGHSLRGNIYWSKKPYQRRMRSAGLRQRRSRNGGHTFLFNSAVRYLKKLIVIDSGELGRYPLYLTAND